MISGGGNLSALQKAMIFIDGTNLFYRLQAANVTIPSLATLLQAQGYIVGHREVLRIYLYSTKEHVEAAVKRHGPEFLNGIRVVLGDSIPSSGGIKEKGVDALLVADLVYHAASRNCDYAALISVDTDFTFAIKRVEDFGCRTAVVGICAEIPDRLKQSCDRHFSIKP